MKSKILLLVMVLIFLSTSCKPEATVQQQKEVQVQESTSEPEQISVEETIHLNNCGGKANTEQVAEHMQSVTIAGEGTIGVAAQVVEASVTAKYAKTKGVSKSQKLIAPPGTNMEFILSWTEESKSGTVTIPGKAGQASYKVTVPLAVDLSSSQDLGCEGVPVASLPTHTPYPTNTPYPTSTPYPTPKPVQATSIPTPIPPENTPPGIPLKPDETWKQDGLNLTLSVVKEIPNNYVGGQIDLKFLIANRTGNELNLSLEIVNVSAETNTGEKYKLTADRHDAWKETLKNGDDTTFEVWFDGNFYSPEVDYILVTVKDWSRIKEAIWKIPIYH